MNTVHPRNRLLPLYIGAAILAALELYAGLGLVNEGAPELAQQAILFAAPALYLPLMYLVLTSQK